jgi:glutamate/tyrosine decarboxylase-like PLP-dependent enzyme
MTDAFPGGALHALADVLAGFHDGIRNQAIVPDVTPESLRQRIATEFGDFAAPREPASVAGAEDPYATTLQWSRRFIGLKLLVALATLGEPGYRELIERMAAMGDRLRNALPDTGWSVVNSTPLPVVCFSHPRLESGAVDPRSLLPHFYRSNVWVSPVRLASGAAALRACVCSFRTREADVDALVAAVRSAPLD